MLEICWSSLFPWRQEQKWIVTLMSCMWSVLMAAATETRLSTPVVPDPVGSLAGRATSSRAETDIPAGWLKNNVACLMSMWAYCDAACCPPRDGYSNQMASISGIFHWHICLFAIWTWLKKDFHPGEGEFSHRPRRKGPEFLTILVLVYYLYKLQPLAATRDADF